MLTILLALVALSAVLVPALRRIQRTPWNGLRDRLAMLRMAGEAGAITLAEAQTNTQDDVDFAVIDELRRYSWLLDQITWDDCVSPGTGGATLTYGYTRLVTPAPAAFRPLNNEYTPGKAVRTRESVDLSPLGGKFDVDRVLAHLGDRRTDEVSFQMTQLLTSVRTKFQDEMVNGAQTAHPSGDGAGSKIGFDGLDSSLAGSSTEVFGGGATMFVDWTSATINDENKAHNALDLLDQLVDTVNGDVAALLGNQKSVARMRSIARRAGYYSRSRDDFGRQVERFGNAVLVDLGDRADGAGPIIPVETRDPDGGGAGGNQTGLTDIYAVRFGMDAYHGVSVAGAPLVKTWLPDFTTAGAVKSGEAEMGPVSTALKATKAAAVLRNVKVQ